jgi:hypothetical protein
MLKQNLHKVAQNQIFWFNEPQSPPCIVVPTFIEDFEGGVQPIYCSEFVKKKTKQ